MLKAIMQQQKDIPSKKVLELYRLVKQQQFFNQQNCLHFLQQFFQFRLLPSTINVTTNSF